MYIKYFSSCTHPLLTYVFLYSYDADIQGCLKKNARSFNSTFRYTDNVLSLSNSKFDDC